MAFTSESEIWCYALLWKLVSKVYVQKIFSSDFIQICYQVKNIKIWWYNCLLHNLHYVHPLIKIKVVCESLGKTANNKYLIPFNMYMYAMGIIFFWQSFSLLHYIHM